MYRLVENQEYNQLKIISQLSAVQLILQQDYLELAHLIIEGEDHTQVMEIILLNLKNFLLNNHQLTHLLKEVGVLVPITIQEVDPNSTPPEPPTPKPSKPKFTVVK